MAKTGKRAKKSTAKGDLRLKLVKSTIGSTEYHRQVVRGLGLRRLNHTVTRKDTPEIRGMIGKVSHLVRIVD